MKRELEFLTELLAFSKGGGVTIWDVRQMIHDRIDDLNHGYTKEEAEAMNKIQSRMDAVDAIKLLRHEIPSFH